ncbi:MAG TPA: carboxypeptidase-like regulatory domain-containing protein, partial [Cytophagaceae bacterium]
MKKTILTKIFMFAIGLAAIAQTATQTIRGKIVDEASKTPLEGATIIIMIKDSATTLGSASDESGNFKISNVPLGRHTLKVLYYGYEELVLRDILVTAGKEVILNIGVVENISQLDDVTITYDRSKDKNVTNNPLSTVSARSFNLDDTKRYAGALGDPSRMAANFAGVVSGNDSRNDIVVRGNSPNGMLWQLEGINIPNPNHFGSLSSTGGPVSLLNNNVLAKSDFLTSAFPSQYGNATAAVFDLRMRNGNDEKREMVGQIGFNGFELGAEGPFT